MGDNSSINEVIRLMNKNLLENDDPADTHHNSNSPDLQDAVAKATGAINHAVSSSAFAHGAIATVERKPIMNPPRIENRKVTPTGKILCYQCTKPGWGKEPKYCGPDCNLYEICEHVQNIETIHIVAGNISTTTYIHTPVKIICGYRKDMVDGIVYCNTDCRVYRQCGLSGKMQLTDSYDILPNLDYIKQHTDYLAVLSTHILEDMIKSFATDLDNVDITEYLKTTIASDIKTIAIERLDRYKIRLELTDLEYEVIHGLIRQTYWAMADTLNERWKEYAFNNRT